MEKRSVTIRFFGLFMLVSVLLNSVTAAHALIPPPVSQQADDDTDKSGNQKISISEWTSDVVVPSHAFSFDSNFIIVPAAQYTFIFSETVAFKTNQPLYRHSYFEKLYEHHIAINAP